MTEIFNRVCCCYILSFCTKGGSYVCFNHQNGEKINNLSKYAGVLFLVR